MELLSHVIEIINSILKWPLVIGLLGTGVFLTIKLGFIQFRRLGHGFAVTSGKYDDPDEPGDVTHFQALTTALSATVGVGNIAGVAMAIHIGGPGALFWMWVTALLGMATKYSEVTLAQHYRTVEKNTGSKVQGTVSGGPMYYIERGLGKSWKPVAIFFAGALMLTSFMTGNAVQANTLATQINDTFGLSPYITGLITATLVGVVIMGGITRIGKVTSIIAPAMAALYVLGALIILGLNITDVPAAFGTIFREAFNPTAGVAGTGIGVFMTMMMYGVQRGLFSNEAGQGSAPIAHSAAKTDEPVSEGVVALLEPFIDTIIICTMTGLVLVTTGVFTERFDGSPLDLGSANVGYVMADEDGIFGPSDVDELRFNEGMAQMLDDGDGIAPTLGFVGVGIDEVYVDEAQTQPFSGRIVTREGERVALADDGAEYAVLYGPAVRNSAPLTSKGFEKGLAPIGLGGVGGWIVLLSVVLFALSTSISWSYYGDRCANYLFGAGAIIPFKAVFIVMHYVGAVLAVTTIWDLGDVALSLVTLPNVIALVLLSGTLKKITDSYFERKPWIENAEVHKRWVEQQKEAKGKR